ncbi:arginine N-methyltransferas-like protein [Tothia fuscella]|uniref:Protein arginine N-methyltransferase n=1 Tax=Tothia fuscella TaxID=1048955 RepID=A0A9P4TZ30_9PEZI|nr:arginine N-methyltransferas-like protein [Tothia fuscella]
MDNFVDVADAPPTWYIGHHETTRLLPVNDQLLRLAQDANYDMITSPITTPHFHSNVQALLSSYHAELDYSHSSDNDNDDTLPIPTPDTLPIPLIPALTPADSPLIPHDNISQLLATTSPWIDLASPDAIIANISRQVFNLEIAYAAFCGIQHVIIQGPILEDGTICTSRLTQYARAIQEAMATGPYLQLYIVLPTAPSSSKAPENQSHLSRFARSRESFDIIEAASAWTSWEAWNVIRTLCNYSGRLTIALTLPKRLPSTSIQSRWYSEPVRIIWIPESSFIPNPISQPVLSRAHKSLLTRFMRLRTVPWLLLSDVGPIPSSLQASEEMNGGILPIAAAAGASAWPLPSDAKAADHKKSLREDPTPHLSYIRFLQRNQPRRDAIERFVGGYQDYLQTPLQPLADNLESITYEVFEKDPIKYEWYERAIARALMDWQAESKQVSSSTGAVVIAVAGSGRGPLVTRALRASAATSVPVQVWAVEKNPNAYVLLQRHNEKEWNRQVTVVKSDMRAWKGPVLPDGTHGHVDILVSELLGSFADNELSPECLDGVQHVLNPANGISIPASYTAHITPIATPKLYADILGKSSSDPSGFELPYVVMLSAFDNLSMLTPEEAELSNTEVKQENGTTPSQDGTTLPIPDVQTCWSFSHPAPASMLAQSNLRRGGSAMGGWGGVNGGDGANEHNGRFAIHNFKCKERGTCHGLAGYFETVLYEGTDGKRVELSTNPVTMDEKSKDMISWFPIFFPVKAPISFPDNSELQVSIWRQTDDRKVWYEWLVEAFVNVGGKKCRLSTSDLHSSKKNGCLM